MNENRFPIASRRTFLIGASSLALSGCSSILSPPQPPKLYPLKPSGGLPTSGSKVDWQLSVVTPSANETLGGTHIVLIQSDGSIDFYADAAWTDDLPVLIRNATVEAFEASGRIGAVAADTDGLHTDYMLQSELRQFAARYDTMDGIPTAVVRIEAKLATSAQRDILASHVFAQETQATENSVPAVIRAFDTGLGPVLSDMVNWALSTAPPVKR